MSAVVIVLFSSITCAVVMFHVAVVVSSFAVCCSVCPCVLPGVVWCGYVLGWVVEI